MTKQLSFSTIKLRQLRSIVDIEPIIEENAFDQWFKFPYTILEEERTFLSQLIDKHQVRINRYSEEELKVKFIAPLLNKVDFTFGTTFTDWYERPISGKINGVYLNGITDYLVAKGFDEPEKPYFFIQEFKPSRPNSDPENQLLAELIVAIENNQESSAIGAHIVGRLWTFVLLRKLDENTFRYVSSVGFNVLDIEDLKKLYIALQGVKADIIQKVEAEAKN